MLVHLDTDLAGDPDDAAALALLLGWPGVVLAGVTTCLDRGGERAGCAAALLELVDAGHVPVVAGAERSATTGRSFASTAGDPRHWPMAPAPRPAPPGAALDALAAGLDRGATLVAIGPLTNLAALEGREPGRLAGAEVVVMGGWTGPPAPGLPAWGPEMDWNVACDPEAAVVVAASGASLTWVTMGAAAGAHLRAADLPRLRSAGPLGALLADQAVAAAADGRMAALARDHDGLPDDLVNVQWDPVTGAIAAGWPGATVEARRVRPVPSEEGAPLEDDPAAPAARVVVDVDGPAFAERFLVAVEAAAGAGGRGVGGSRRT